MEIRLSFRGRPQVFHLEDEYGPIPPERLYQPYFGRIASAAADS
ncbi:MAG: hypothetical protein ACLVJ6_11785 [Merdibacter sp.]